MDEQSDAELLRRWAVGDTAAGSRLVARHFTAVFRFFRRSHPEDAEDLTQRTFVACQENVPKLARAVSFRAFLLGIARNVLLADVRAEGRRRHRHARAAREPRALRTSPSAAVAAREEQQLLLTALRTLSVEQQVALELHYWEQFSTAEIASALEIPQGTVKWRLSEARKALRRALEAAPADDRVREATITSLESWASSLRGLLDDG